jgi:hypothetical protein
MAVTWSFDHSAIYHDLHLRLAIANDISLAIGITKIYRSEGNAYATKASIQLLQLNAQARFIINI